MAEDVRRWRRKQHTVCRSNLLRYISNHAAVWLPVADSTTQLSLTYFLLYLFRLLSFLVSDTQLVLVTVKCLCLLATFFQDSCDTFRRCLENSNFWKFYTFFNSLYAWYPLVMDSSTSQMGLNRNKVDSHLPWIFYYSLPWIFYALSMSSVDYFEMNNKFL